MSEFKKAIKFLATWVTVLAGTVISLAHCGVKGDPMPPDLPPAIGRGHVNYKEAFSDSQPVAPAKDAVKPANKSDKQQQNNSDEDKNEDDESDD